MIAEIRTTASGAKLTGERQNTAGKCKAFVKNSINRPVRQRVADPSVGN